MSTPPTPGAGRAPRIDRARLREVAEAFAIDGRWLGSEPLRLGWINDTFIARFETPSGVARFVQQRINRQVFADPFAVMENVSRVIEHQRRALAREAVRDAERRALSLVPTRRGDSAYGDREGEVWRSFVFIEGASSRNRVRGTEDARAAAFAFARFQRQLADLPGPRLNETIPHFQDARVRFEQLLEAVREDPAGRLAGCRAEVDFVLAREASTDRLRDALASGRLPERVTHGDTKINNVLFDDRSGEALCVVDLDTVMPGLGLYDFGDLVRTTASGTDEDETRLDRIRCAPDLLAALVEGWVAGAGAALATAERDEMVFASFLVALTIGMRFLADHLAGDRYFRCEKPEHNLVRARAQLALAADLERRRSELDAIADEAAERALRPA